MRVLFVTLITAVLLGGCGFKPMYRADADTPAVTSHLAAVQIDQIPDRLGQRVHNELLNLLTPMGVPGAPVYRLSVQVQEKRDNIALLQNETITRANYRLSASFRLLSIDDETVLVDGATWAATSFDVVQSDYSTLMAERAAQERLSKEIAEEIRVRLALYFSRED